jgi:hypothetical protein
MDAKFDKDTQAASSSEVMDDRRHDMLKRIGEVLAST